MPLGEKEKRKYNWIEISNEWNTITEHLLFKDLQLTHSGNKAKNTMC